MKKRWGWWMLTAMVVLFGCACERTMTDTATEPPDVDTSCAQTIVTTTTAAVGNDAPVWELNGQLLDEIGMTAAELKDKYGAVSHVVCEQGGPNYLFGTAGHYHSFGGFDGVEGILPDGTYPTVPTDVTGNWVFEEAPFPRKDSVCTSLWYVRVSDLFLGMTELTSADDLAERYGVKTDGASYSPMHEDYFAGFEVNGLYVCACSDENGMIDPQGWIMFIKPRDNRAAS